MNYLANLCLVVIGCTAFAASNADPLRVDTTRLIQQPGYEVNRIYAGEVRHRRESQLGFETAGTVQHVHVSEGDHVTAGMALAELDKSALEADLAGALTRVETAAANLLASRAQLGLSLSTLKRHEALIESGHASAQRLEELRMQHRVDAANVRVAASGVEAAEADVRRIRVGLDKAVLYAPFDGRITTRNYDEGSIVSPGQVALGIAEHGHYEAWIGLPEEVAAYLESTRSYDFKVGKRRVVGKLKSQLPKVHAASANVTAVFEIEGSSLFAGSLTEMYLPVFVDEPGFWVPIASLAESQRGLWSLMVVKDASDVSALEPRLVEILYRGDDEVFVRGTLSTGDLIVASGTSRVVPGQLVSVAAAGE